MTARKETAGRKVVKGGAKGRRGTVAKATAKGPAPERKWTLPSVTRREGERRYWLLKSEPDVYSFDDLMRAPDRTTCWDGVRNNQARLYLRDQMKVGDGVLYYHSGGDEPAIAGIARVVREGYPDPTAFDAKHPHFDPKAKPANPWIMVDVQGIAALAAPLTLTALRAVTALAGMILLQKGSRLSVQPVSPTEWTTILALGGVEA